MTTAMTRRWPAEWEGQGAIWFAWPHNRSTWPGNFASIPAAYAALVRQASEYLPAKLLAAGPLADQAKRFFAAARDVEMIEIPTNDLWIRDYGPTFVLEGGDLIGIDWRYNAWGGKYHPHDSDAAAAKAVCAVAGVRCESSPLGLEGGAIETDGQGRLLTTPDCVITDSRNPGWTREQISEEFVRRLGVSEIVWVDGGGLEGDDTDGHIDQLARFVNPEHVVCAVSSDRDDPNREGLERNYQQLVRWGEETSPRVTIHRMETPPPRFMTGGNRVPESYTNFLMLADRAVLVPTFRHRRYDDAAMRLLRELLPGRPIIGIDAFDFAWGLGAWHCASQQQPLAGA
jgi:agmatine deiminase